MRTRYLLSASTLMNLCSQSIREVRYQKTTSKRGRFAIVEERLKESAAGRFAVVEELKLKKTLSVAGRFAIVEERLKAKDLRRKCGRSLRDC